MLQNAAKGEYLFKSQMCNYSHFISTFNKLLLELKKGEFKFELDDDKEDLFFHISTEYISQLNAELSSIYKELEDYDLLKVKATEEEE